LALRLDSPSSGLVRGKKRPPNAVFEASSASPDLSSGNSENVIRHCQQESPAIDLDNPLKCRILGLIAASKHPIFKDLNAVRKSLHILAGVCPRSDRKAGPIRAGCTIFWDTVFIVFKPDPATLGRLASESFRIRAQLPVARRSGDDYLDVCGNRRFPVTPPPPPGLLRWNMNPR
jgi:hypothetical protein